MSYKLDIGDKAFFINRESESGISEVTIIARQFRTGVVTVTEDPTPRKPVSFETEPEFLFQTKEQAVEYVKAQISTLKERLKQDADYITLLENSIK